MRLLAILLLDRTAHGEAPNYILVRRLKQYRIRIGELNVALLLVVVENGHRLLPSIAIISRYHGEDIPHVLLAIGHGSKSHDQMPAFPLGYEGLPDSPRIRVLIHMPQLANFRHIAFIVTEVSLFAGKQWQGDERKQGQ